MAEWLEYKGYFVRRNVKVGKLPHGGFQGELDIVGYHPLNNHLIQIEPSIDAHTWEKREQRFRKKFEAGRKYIIPEIFPWLPHNKTFEQWAVLWGSDKNHSVVGSGKVVPIWKLYKLIAKDIIAIGSPVGSAIPEQFPLLRTMQYTLYWAAPEKLEDEDA
ncbi:MAG: hypothetical protein GXX96_39495 [Planctomycetaceae bacterium]|nr:hypothetical protein [Planctomycetaceae bacterium]